MLIAIALNIEGWVSLRLTSLNKKPAFLKAGQLDKGQVVIVLSGSPLLPMINFYNKVIGCPLNINLVFVQPAPHALQIFKVTALKTKGQVIRSATAVELYWQTDNHVPNPKGFITTITTTF